VSGAYARQAERIQRVGGDEPPGRGRRGRRRFRRPRFMSAKDGGFQSLLAKLRAPSTVAELRCCSRSRGGMFLAGAGHLGAPGRKRRASAPLALESAAAGRCRCPRCSSLRFYHRDQPWNSSQSRRASTAFSSGFLIAGWWRQGPASMSSAQPRKK